jgi:hypothetical protein
MSDSVSTGLTAFCGQCGHKNAPGFNFCQSCGTQGGHLETEVNEASADTSEAEPSMTLLKAASIYAAAILVHIVLIKFWPDGIVLAYLMSGFVMTRIVMRGLIEWHPNYNTLDNVVSGKMSMFALWPIQMASLLFKLMFNKVM